jgi:glucose-6-phosphate-specific signal transduction histidine kinase
MKLKNSWIYWACQIAGWGTYSAVVFGITTAFTGWRANILICFLLFFIYSIGLTHLLRRTIRKRQWLAERAFPGLLYVFAGAVATGLFQTVLIVVIARAAVGPNVFDTTGIISAASSVTFICCVWAAAYVVVHWYRRYRESQLREVQAQLSLQRAELRALQAQVNPHFLFNSLNAIRGTVRENPEQAEGMITSLSNLFRRSLRSDGAQLIPLAEEMEAVSDYLALESARFDERLKVLVEVQPEAGQWQVPAMLVQTLVENAVKHGISKLPKGGCVCIRGALDDHSLVLEIENTGSLRQEDSEPRGMHTGLANARERLRLLCGSRASLSLSDRDGKVAAKVVIPGRV